MTISNPFKFGTIVDGPYFTNRTLEIEKVKSIISSQNHLTIISPRRFGKSSLIAKVAGQLDRPTVAVDMQLITSPSDLAAQILKRIYRIFPFEKVRQFVQHFRIIPTISVNPVNNQVDISFLPDSSQVPMLEDVLNLLEKLSSANRKLLVIFDEFQETKRISADLMPQLRAIMQHHKLVNYVFLGSQESLIREIFERKKSPFYHFGMVMPLGKIPEKDFIAYLHHGFSAICNDCSTIVKNILNYTGCHPYYTQQLAFQVWNILNLNSKHTDPVNEATNELIAMHEMDYERIWMVLNRTDKKLIIGLSSSGLAPLSEAFYRKYDIGASSTAFSSLKRLVENGYLIKAGNNYEIDDPFFSLWLKQRLDK